MDQAAPDYDGGAGIPFVSYFWEADEGGGGPRDLEEGKSLPYLQEGDQGGPIKLKACEPD